MQVSALSADALQELADLKEFAFAEVNAQGVIGTLNPFARLCWDFEEGHPMPDDVAWMLREMQPDSSETLPLKKGGLYLHAVRLAEDQGWVVIGYEPDAIEEEDEEGGEFAQLLDQMPAIVLRMQTDGTVLSVNQEGPRRTGYSREDIVGIRFWSRVAVTEHISEVEQAIRSVTAAKSGYVSFQYRTMQGVVRRAEMHLYFSEAYEVEAVVFDLTRLEGQGVDDGLSGALRNAIDQSPMGMLWIDVSGTVRYMNNRVREILGITTSAGWLNRTIDEAKGFDPTAAKTIRRCLVEGDAARGIEASFETASGTIQRANLAVSPVYSETERAGCTIIIQTVGGRDGWDDPKSRYEAASAALREVATASPDDNVFLDSAARIIGEASGADRVRILLSDPAVSAPFTRAQWTATIGYARQRYEGDREVLVTMGPNNELYVGPEHDADAAALASVIELHEAIWLRLKQSGGYDAYLALERLPGGDGARTAWTARERSHLENVRETFETLWSWIQVGARYRMIVAAIENVLFGFAFGEDGARRYLFATDQVESLTGHAAPEFVDLRSGTLDWIEDVVHPEDRAMVRAHDRTLEQGHESKITYRIRHRNGDVRWVLEQAAPHPDPTGFSTVSGTLTDLTERKEAEEMLLSAKQQAETQARRKTAFMATMSHEIRTPLGAVQGYSQLLDREIAETEQSLGVRMPDEVKEFVKAIGDRSKRLLELVQDLFEVSNLEMGEVTLRKSPVAIHGVIRKSAQKLAAQLREKGVRMHLQLDSRDPKVLGDAHRLEQVFDNLLANAVKFTDEGSVTVTTRHQRSEVDIEVIDTGVGISEEFQARLFEPFTQEEDWKNRRFQGTGLGLALVRKLLQLMDGRIEVESVKDGGSTFRITLPAASTPDLTAPRMPKAHRG
ncbi:MAG: PAS domain S-box protein [Rhodothermales bacterium]|nr:PAS domain S-box protein [Rhodothermales bacterium]MBO6778343.1 PAS domain S-box protein [Rhodothermales bacterium]